MLKKYLLINIIILVLHHQFFTLLNLISTQLIILITHN